MQRVSRPEGLAISSPRGPRSQSLSSDRPSLSATSIIAPPISANPEPVYIAPSAASQLVASELDNDGATVSSGALTLVNGFLDQILFSILARARSTQLNTLRPAVLEILKPRLGKEAITGADEELREYLGDGEDEELASFYGGQEPKGEFDLELAWKLARLRCMVYTRLGDMEEDDEDEYIEKENLDDGYRALRRYSNSSTVTPAAAIFLTSILEYLGEQALYYAGQATQQRLVTLKPDDFTALPGIPDKPVVEESDMFAVGRDSPLSRLWRTWRRNVKSPRGSLNRMFSSESLTRRELSSRKGSMNLADGSELPHPSVAEVLHAEDPSQIPLPMSENDVNEIEVPGLAPEIDDGNEVAQADETPATKESQRPKSMIVYAADNPPTPVSPSFESRASGRPRPTRLRSRSLPTPVQSPYRSPYEEENSEAAFVTPFEKADPMQESAEEEQTPTQEQQDAMERDGVTQVVEGGAPAEGVVAKDVAAEDVAAEDEPAEVADDDGASMEGESAAALAAAMAGDTVAFHTGSTTNSSGRSPKRHGINASDGADDVDDLNENTSKAELSEILALKAARIAAINNRRPSGTATRSVPSKEHSVSDPEDLALSSDDRQPPVPAKHRDQGFILAAPPHPRREKSSEKSTDIRVQGRSVDPKTTNSDAPTPPRKDSGVSRLTPLEEMTENANDTSEAPSLASSSTNQRTIRPVANVRDPKVSNDSPQVRTTITAGHPPPTDRNLDGTRSQRSGSMNDPRRVPPSPQRTPKQATFDSMQTSSGKRAQRSGSEGKQSLEDLIKTDATLRYTLTPQNVRETEVNDSPQSQKRTATSDLADFLKNTAPPDDNAPRPITSRSTTPSKATNGLRSHPPEPVPAVKGQERRRRSSSLLRASQSASPRSSRSHNVQPREATIDRHTTRDLADFAKSTGPETAAQLPRSLKSRLLRSSVDETARAETPTRMNNSGGRSSPTKHQGLFRHSSSAARTGPRLQARDPTLSRAEESSDLIDFIREGPPRDPREGTHRIPRTVAPFRTTMDSEEMNGVASPKDRDLLTRTSMTSTQDSSTVAKSMQSSTNSRTALLENNNRATPKQTNGTGSAPVDRSFGLNANVEDTMQPKRKQRRVRDPYAIDTDSEEEEEQEQSTPRAKPQQREESLIDFLRNTSPPPESRFQPQPLMVSDVQKARAAKGIRPSASSPTLQERSQKLPVSNGSGKTAAVPDGVYASNQKRTNTSRSDSRPKQTGTRIDSLNHTQPISTSQGNRTTNPNGQSTAGLQPKRAGVGATADLADFLRNSGPPEPVRPVRSPSPVEAERAGFARIFSRRRKIAA